jgi:cytochrome c551/c552
VIVAVACVLAAPDPASAAASSTAAPQRAAVVVVPVFPLDRYAARGAVGLLVPGSGAWVSRAGARAALVRGKVQNALLGGVATGKPLIELAQRPGPVTIYVSLPPPGRSHNVRRYPVAVVGGGYRGRLTSASTRIPGLVAITDVAPSAVALAHGEQPSVRSRADADAAADLRALDTKLTRTHDLRLAATLVVVFAILLLLPLGCSLLVPPAVIGASLVLSAVGATEPWVVVPLLCAAALLLPVALRGVVPIAVTAFLVAFLVVLVAWPETVSLAAIGPHPDGGGRFYGVTNQIETLLLGPALAAGVELGVVPIGLLTLVTFGWSRAGADGGGALVVAVAFAVLWLRQRRHASLRDVVLAGAVAVASVAALYGLDRATGGSSHVTQAAGGGPATLVTDLGHRLHTSWAAATATWVSAFEVCACLGALVVIALLWPRRPSVDAFLVAIALSLLVNDTPTDVAAYGALGAGSLVAWEWTRRGQPKRSFRLAAVPRPAPMLLLLALLAVGVAGCSHSEGTVGATAETVIGTLPKQKTLPKGTAAAGKPVFASSGCGGCHTYAPAGSNASVGPDLDKLAQYTKQANAGDETEFIHESIANPSAYIQPGYPDVMPKDYGQKLSDKQLADLIAFLEQK